MVLFLCRFLFFAIFMALDMCCFIYEKTSVTNCSQKVLVSNPLPFVHLWNTTSIAISLIILLGLRVMPSIVKFCGFQSAFKRLRKDSSCWCLILSFFAIMVDYFIRIVNEGTSLSRRLIPVGYTFSKALHLLVLYALNFAHIIPVDPKPRSLQNIAIRIVYWLTIVVYFLESFYGLISSSLDAMENIFPLGNSTGNEHRAFLVMLSLLLCTKVVFFVRVSDFFWKKFFHGNKDILSNAKTLADIED